MTRKVVYFVFLLPVVISVSIAAFVLAAILDQSDRAFDLRSIDDNNGKSSTYQSVYFEQSVGDGKQNQAYLKSFQSLSNKAR